MGQANDITGLGAVNETPNAPAHGAAMADRLQAAIAAEREACAKCRDAVPVLPGDMPDEMWGTLSKDRNAAAEALRIIVRQTLDEYESAIRARSNKVKPFFETILETIVLAISILALVAGGMLVMHYCFTWWIGK